MVGKWVFKNFFLVMEVFWLIESLYIKVVDFASNIL